ncbi:energy transducer TonB [Nonlabens sp. YIK11]|uniref:energy transducer TonB n=1 Tax=Nonlabens sp. YIK11 TaxID=1453349 RepID=UPI0006DD0149|nr:energy transducer TonB [Nonlabens sp. YIK11]
MRNLDSKVGAATPTGTSRADKKSVSIKTNSSINFLIGLCAVMMFSFVVIELQTPKIDREYTISLRDDYVIESNLDRFRIEKSQPEPRPVKQPKEPKVQEPKVNKIKPPVIVDNSDPEPTEDPEPNDTPVDEPAEDSPTTTTSEPSKTAPVSSEPRNVMSVTEVPLFPGCSASLNNEERINCLNEKMQRFVQRRFDLSLANELNNTKQVNITVVFTIGTDGLPKDLIVQAPNEKLKKEAYRIVSKLPKMTPGKFEGADVNTTYALPIIFRIQ